MALSQQRTRVALGIILDLKEVEYERDWLREKLTANGLSSSQLIFDDAGEEDAQRSRCVKFVVVTDAQTRLASIISELN